jgi:hypothetical protein
MTRVLFVADQFANANRSSKDRHPGGAELTDAAAIVACPWPLRAISCGELERESARFLDDFEVIVLGNARSASRGLEQRIAATGRHVLFEHDLRICRYRGNFPVARDPAHRSRLHCWCPHLSERALFDGALGTIFLTKLQERIYRANASFACHATHVLGSSLFDARLLERRESALERSGTCLFASPHAIKGHRQALEYCRHRGIGPTEIKNLTPSAVLDLFARSERFVNLPIGPEWAGRMVVEARLLGCEVVANDLVGVTGEPFWGESREQALAFLLDGPARFWRLVEQLQDGAAARPTRSPSLRDGALDTLAWAMHALPLRLWPAGPSHGALPEPRSYPAW